MGDTTVPDHVTDGSDLQPDLSLLQSISAFPDLPTQTFAFCFVKTRPSTAVRSNWRNLSVDPKAK
jgi:hypothetical protein